MNPSTALATVLIDELVRCGVHEVVVCPGSRSAPLAYAALEAERDGLLRLHVRVDERSAGYLALGLAKGSAGSRARSPHVAVSGSPVAIVTTSGTAVGNLHPAVLEAHHANVPLVVLSADRPHELRGTGANQTTTQPGVFGSATRADADLPAPERRPGQHAWWRTTVCRAVAAATGATGGDPGPAHLNVSLREPLVPAVVDDGWPEPLDGRAAGLPWVEVGPCSVGRFGPADSSGLADWPLRTAPAVEHVERTLVVIGDVGSGAAAVAASRWAAARGYPCVAEPLGSLSVRAEELPHGSLPHGPLLLTVTDWLNGHLPERVVVIGRATLARPVAALLRRPGVRVEVVSIGSMWSDPSHVVAAAHPWSAIATDAITGTAVGWPHADADVRPDTDVRPGADGAPGFRASGGSMTRSAWAKAWDGAGSRVADAVAAQGFPWPSGLAVADVVARALPGDAALVVGSSNPVRDLDLAVAGRRGRQKDPSTVTDQDLATADQDLVTAGSDLATAGSDLVTAGSDLATAGDDVIAAGGHDVPLGVPVFANRGLAGIDGVVSTAVGIGLSQGLPTIALLGDLTFLHDANGLLIGPDEPRPDLTLVVVNDDGGGIFSALEPGAPEHAAGFERLFGTPTGTDVAALCRAHGIRHDLAESREQLAALVGEPPHGIRVVEVRVDRATHRAAHEALRALASQALADSAARPGER